MTTETTTQSVQAEQELLEPLGAFAASLGEGWLQVTLETIENAPGGGDEFVNEGGASCVDGAVGISISTSTKAPLEAIGEWARADQPHEADILYGFRAASSGQAYAAVTRALVIVSGFGSADDAAGVAERIRSGLSQTCVGGRSIEVNLPDGRHEATWDAELVTYDRQQAHEVFVLNPHVVSSDGIALNNPFAVGVARYGRILMTTSVVDARTDGGRLDPAGVLEVVGEAINQSS